MADTARQPDTSESGHITALDGKVQAWVERMLPLLDGPLKRPAGPAERNKPDVLRYQDLPRTPPGMTIAGPAPPADVDLLTSAIKAKDAHKVQQYVTLLIVSGYHLAGPDSNGDYPLILAAKSNDFIITSMVVHDRPNPRNSAGETPLIIAARLGNVQIVELLLKKRANVTLTDKAQKTALDYALQNQKSKPANKDYAQIVKLLQDAQQKSRKPKKP